MQAVGTRAHGLRLAYDKSGGGRREHIPVGLDHLHLAGKAAQPAVETVDGGELARFQDYATRCVSVEAGFLDALNAVAQCSREGSAQKQLIVLPVESG